MCALPDISHDAIYHYASSCARVTVLRLPIL